MGDFMPFESDADRVWMLPGKKPGPSRNATRSRTDFGTQGVGHPLRGSVYQNPEAREEAVKRILKLRVAAEELKVEMMGGKN